MERGESVVSKWSTMVSLFCLCGGIEEKCNEVRGGTRRGVRGRNRVVWGGRGVIGGRA